MTTTLRGSIAAAALCALLAACGGSGDTPPTQLPASVTITNSARAEAGTSATFGTDLATTTGLTFRWDFGDGSTGVGATASHAYAKPGTYQVTLAVANDAEDLRTSTSTIEVGAYANTSGLVCSQADSAGWCWQHAIVTGHAINDVFFVDATHAWAVGDSLTMLKSADGGSTWSPVALDPTLSNASLGAVRFYDAKHGMALTDQGSALVTSDGGATWTASSYSLVLPGPTTFVDYRAGRVVLQSTNGGNGLMSADEGSTWSAVGTYGPIQTTSTDCWSFTSGSAERAAGCGPSAAVPLPSYLPNGSAYFMGGTFASDSQGLVVGSGFSYDNYSWVTWAWATADGGATWTSFTPNGLPLYGYYSLTLHMQDAQAGLLYSPNDLTAYATADGGHDWTAVTPSPALTQNYGGYRASGIAGNGVLWQAMGNRLSLSTDRGQTWHDATVHAEDAASPTAQASVALVTQYMDANDFVVAIGRRFYATSDGGQSFRQLLGPDSRDVGAPHAVGEFVDDHHGKFLTANGVLLSTADGGRTWTRLDYGVAAGAGSGVPVALHFTSATEGWLILNGVLDHSTDGGATWSTPLVNSAMTFLQGMSWSDATHGWTWNNGSLFVTADGGATWTKAATPSTLSVTSAAMTGPLTGVIVSGYASATTQDGGATWQIGSTNGPFTTLVRGAGQAIWSLPGYGYGAQVLRSKDGGRSWAAAGPVTGNSYATGIAFADELHGWMVTSTGGVLRTIDGGDSWTAQPVGSDVVPLAVVAVDAMTAWIITADGQILATATAGN